MSVFQLLMMFAILACIGAAMWVARRPGRAGRYRIAFTVGILGIMVGLVLFIIFRTVMLG